MKRMRAVLLGSVIMAACFVLTASPALAQATVCPNGPTQGALALAMAQQIWGAAGPQTESDAIQRFQEAGVMPPGGWVPDACAEPVKAELETLLAEAIRQNKFPAGTQAGIVGVAFAIVKGAYDTLTPGGGDPLSNKKSSASPSQ